MINNKRNSHVIIIGGSVAGCVMAEVMSTHFDQVTIVEKDNFYNESDDRKNVPQEKFSHFLMKGGEKMLNTIFTNFSEDLKTAGALSNDIGKIPWFQNGLWKKDLETGEDLLIFSRRLLDNCLRKRIKENKKVSILSESAFESFLYHSENGINRSLRGIKYLDFGDNTVKELSADLVIDAGGLGTRTSKLLKEDGFGATSEQVVINNVGYTSRIYSRDPRSDQDSLLILLFPQPPHQKTIGIATPIENGRWLVTIAGWFNQFPKQNADSFDDYMKNHLPSQEIYNKIKDCEPLSGVSMYKHPKSIWKRYDTLQNFPDGLLVVGASLCSINPFLGQGMTLSIMQAKTTDKFIAGWQKGKYPTKFIQKSSQKTFRIHGKWENWKI
ncbi:FAD-dependent monooxygenase [Chryseobacterium sp. JUb7]|uniref:FAD-dependent monooxygenase n=1 Tax=Chryseobacterium sp. JUb7 TaxID=2940599 RepID=UPI002167B557|nr:FAD-dependent monooxygenase [Chryseobacterium sp. JUb7]